MKHAKNTQKTTSAEGVGEGERREWDLQGNCTLSVANFFFVFFFFFGAKNANGALPAFRRLTATASTDSLGHF